MSRKIFIATFCLISMNAYASDYGIGILTGIFGTLFVQKIHEPEKPKEVYYPIYLAPELNPHTPCGDIPVYDQNGRLIAYRRIPCR